MGKYTLLRFKNHKISTFFAKNSYYSVYKTL